MTCSITSSFIHNSFHTRNNGGRYIHIRSDHYTLNCSLSKHIYIKFNEFPNCSEAMYDFAYTGYSLLNKFMPFSAFFFFFTTEDEFLGYRINKGSFGWHQAFHWYCLFESFPRYPPFQGYLYVFFFPWTIQNMFCEYLYYSWD